MPLIFLISIIQYVFCDVYLFNVYVRKVEWRKATRRQTEE